MPNAGMMELGGGKYRAQIDSEGVWRADDERVASVLNANYPPPATEAGTPWIEAFYRAARELGGKIVQEPVAEPYPPKGDGPKEAVQTA